MAPPPPWEFLGRAAGSRYDHEPVTQLDHALQTAALAQAQGASPSLQLAALFHDIGHLFHEDAGAISAEGRDARHEEMGARYLARWYGEEVSEPVRLHVAAKRLLARDPGYRHLLSDESRLSLRLQGGPFTAREAAAFAGQPHAAAALSLRRWDDLAKDAEAIVPRLHAWIPLARELARR